MILSGAETIKEIRKNQTETILAFSRGKDSVTAWLKIRDHFDKVVPYFLYFVPGLEFIDKSVQYFEKFFDTKIIQLPHPSTHRLLNNLVFQPPQNCAVIEQAKLPNFNYEDIRQAVIQISGVDKNTFVADGVRAADSPMRRIAISTHGTISHTQKKYHPVWDIKKQEIVDLFKKHSVKLPIDYELFGRSFDGIDLRFLLPLKKYLPHDYSRMLEFFPFADLEIYRWEAAHGKY